MNVFLLNIPKYFTFAFPFSGNPSLRHGKPGTGVGLGYGLRLKSPLGHLQVDLAMNSFKQKTVYFGFSNVS